MPPTPKETPAPAVTHPDEKLCAAVAHLHRGQGLTGVKRVGAEFLGRNHRGQLVVTHADRAEAHASHLDAHPEECEAPEPPAPDAPADPYLPAGVPGQS